jgi:ubiquinone/menaquinone biosynthesis C-methylase UbiE
MSTIGDWESFDKKSSGVPLSASTSFTWFVENLPKGARILDVGGGNGIIASEFLELRPDLLIDIIDVDMRKLAE